MTILPSTALIVLPTIIDRAGKYITRGGESVVIEKVSIGQNFGCRGFYSDGVQEGWHKSGRLYFGQQSKNDIVRAA